MAKFDLKKLQSYADPEKIKDLDRFLDTLPGNVGVNSLIFAFSSWVLAGLMITFMVMQTTELTQLRTKLLEVEALKPPVPIINYSEIKKKHLEKTVEMMADLYPGVKYNIEGNGKVLLSAGTVNYIPQFRAAISHLQNGGKSWRVTLSDLCFGKECNGPDLQATLHIENVRVSDAEKKTEKKK